MRTSIGVTALALVVSACSSSTTETTTGEPPPTAATVTTAAPAAAPGGCVGCHTDEEALRVLAVEPPDTESLSEGEG